MDKEIALAVNFAKAPPELQAAAVAADANQKKLNKAQAKLVADQADVAKLEADQQALEKTFRKLLNAWDPTAVTVA